LGARMGPGAGGLGAHAGGVRSGHGASAAQRCDRGEPGGPPRQPPGHPSPGGRLPCVAGRQQAQRGAGGGHDEVGRGLIHSHGLGTAVQDWEIIIVDDGSFDGIAQRVLELNGRHMAVESLLRAFERDATDPRVEAYARLLYDQAVLAEGSKVKDPAAFAGRINELLVKDARV